MQKTTLIVNEIFFSIQGESLLAGKPSVFVRLASCNLHCDWCDTEYARHEGEELSIGDIITKVKAFESEYVCVTGGEPLTQAGAVLLLSELLKCGYTVSLETNGSFSIKDVPREVIKVIDIKCPDSGESEKNCWENINLVTKQDQFKFVVASKADFDWAENLIQKNGLNERCTVLFSTVYGRVKPSELAKWILDSKANVTMQVPMHKQIWGPDEKGV